MCRDHANGACAVQPSPTPLFSFALLLQSKKEMAVQKLKGGSQDWKLIQERTFTNWVNDRLRGNLRVSKSQVK